MRGSFSAPDAHGFCWLGDGIAHVDDIDYGVDCAVPPHAVHAPRHGDVDQRNIRDRARALIGIAAPELRDGLLAEARRLGYL